MPGMSAQLPSLSCTFTPAFPLWVQSHKHKVIKLSQTPVSYRTTLGPGVSPRAGREPGGIQEASACGCALPFLLPLPSLVPAALLLIGGTYYTAGKGRGSGMALGLGVVLGGGGVRAQSHLDVCRVLLQSMDHPCQVWC